MPTQHPEHVQQLMQQQLLLSCSTQNQEIRLFQNQLQKTVTSFHLPPAHSLLSFPLFSPSQTILVSLLLLFCHCFLGGKKKFTSYFSTVACQKDLQGAYSGSKTKNSFTAFFVLVKNETKSDKFQLYQWKRPLVQSHAFKEEITAVVWLIPTEVVPLHKLQNRTQDRANQTCTWSFRGSDIRNFWAYISILQRILYELNVCSECL